MFRCKNKFENKHKVNPILLSERLSSIVFLLLAILFCLSTAVVFITSIFSDEYKICNKEKYKLRNFRVRYPEKDDVSSTCGDAFLTNIDFGQCSYSDLEEEDNSQLLNKYPKIFNSPESIICSELLICYDYGPKCKKKKCKRYPYEDNIKEVAFICNYKNSSFSCDNYEKEISTTKINDPDFVQGNNGEKEKFFLCYTNNYYCVYYRKENIHLSYAYLCNYDAYNYVNNYSDYKYNFGTPCIEYRYSINEKEYPDAYKMNSLYDNIYLCYSQNEFK